MNAVFLRMLTDLIFISSQPAGSGRPKATVNCAHAEHLSKHTCKAPILRNFIHRCLKTKKDLFNSIRLNVNRLIRLLFTMSARMTSFYTQEAIILSSISGSLIW